MLVGAPLKDSPLASGTILADSGAAYLFDASTGDILHTLDNPTELFRGEFGTSVWLSVDGGTALVGAPGDDTVGNNAGSAYLFDVSTGGLLRTINNPVASGQDTFGSSVALSADGKTALVGASGHDNSNSKQNSGAAYLFDTSTGSLLQTFNNPTPATGEKFGNAIALSGDGTTALFGVSRDNAGATAGGAAYLFDVTTGNLVQTIISPAPTNFALFGFSVSLSDEGRIALIGAAEDATRGSGFGAVYLFDVDAGSFVQTIINPRQPDAFAFLSQFGNSVSLSVDGRSALVGALREASDDNPNSRVGRAYVFGDAGDVVLSVSEPSAIAFLGIGFLMLVGFQRRRRR